MTRSELVNRLATRYPALYIREIELVVDVFLEEIKDALNRDDRIELRGFGTFGMKTRAPRKARNPRNGETVMVEQKRVPYFKMGKKLFEALND